MKKLLISFVAFTSFGILSACNRDHLVVNKEMNQQNPEDSILYLWQEGNMPATTSYLTVANSNNPDEADIRPNTRYYPPKNGVEIKRYWSYLFFLWKTKSLLPMLNYSDDLIYRRPFSVIGCRNLSV